VVVVEGPIILETPNQSNERDEPMLALHGMCHYQLRRDGHLRPLPGRPALHWLV